MKNTLTLVIFSLFISTTGFCKGYTIRDNGNGTFDVRCTGSMSWTVASEYNFTKIEYARSMGQKHCIGKIDNVGPQNGFTPANFNNINISSMNSKVGLANGRTPAAISDGKTSPKK